MNKIANIGIMFNISPCTLKTHGRSLKKWVCIFPIFYAVVLLYLVTLGIEEAILKDTHTLPYFQELKVISCLTLSLSSLFFF